ncbi:MAG: hypothetical protein ACRERV_00490 [Methylococcales bacterium]
MINDDVEELFPAVLKAGKGGDMTACKILFDRVCPPLKPLPPPLPALDPGRLSEQMNEIAASIIAGELSPHDSNTLLRTLLHVRTVADNS